AAYTPPVAKADLLEARLRYAYQVSLCREPSSKEISILTKLYQDALAECQANPSAADELMGDALPDRFDTPDAMDVPETAAYIAVARAILNLDEFITRE